MNDQEKFLLLMALLAVGANGWGLSTVSLITRSRRLADGRVRLEPAMNVAIGIALFIAVGGFFVAGNAAYFPFLLGWQIVGVCFTFVDVLANRAVRIRGSLLRIQTVPALLAGGFLVFLALGPALSSPWNQSDDGPAYSYLGQRILSTGGLIDPFNTRRLNSYGAAELFQALVIKMVTILAGVGIEWFFFLLLIIALFVRSFNRRFAVVALITVGLGIEIAHPVGAFANIAPSFSGAALTLALARIICEHEDQTNSRWVYVLAGLLLAALFALRLEFVPPALLLVFAAVWYRRRWRVACSLILITGAVAALSLAGWAIALDRSSRTPIFPLFASYWTQASWFLNPAIHTLGQHIANFISIAQDYHWDIGLLGSLALGAAAVWIARLVSRDLDCSTAQRVRGIVRMDIVWALAIGCAADLLYEEFAVSGGAIGDLMRYAEPSLLAFVLFVLDRVWALALEVSPPRGRSLDTTTKSRCYPLMLGVSSLCFFTLFISSHPSFYQTFFSRDLRQAVAASSGQSLFTDTWNAKTLRAEEHYYTKMNARIPKGTHLLAAVEWPGLLDMSKFSFTSLDEPGGTSPPPHISYNAGPKQLVHYLRQQGIDGIVANTADSLSLYNLQTSEGQLNSSVNAYRLAAEYTVKWDKLLLGVEQLYETYRVGPLRYISLSRPR